VIFGALLYGGGLAVRFISKPIQDDPSSIQPEFTAKTPFLKLNKDSTKDAKNSFDAIEEWLNAIEKVLDHEMPKLVDRCA